jgi:hypothetical protein
MQKIKITSGDIELDADLYDTPTAQKIMHALPITGRVNLWGAEVYFRVPIDADMEADARDVLSAGELAYWPPGHAFCIFWGPTPASTESEPRAASDVNVFGKILGDISILQNVTSGSEIRIELVDILEES